LQSSPIGNPTLLQIINPNSSEKTGKPPVAWLQQYPIFYPYRLEICALCGYLHTREHTTNRGKFILVTVEKNVITPNISLDKRKLKSLVTLMQKENFLVPEKTSFKLTSHGKEMYARLKADQFTC
jgi:hypothetical protein